MWTSAQGGLAYVALACVVTVIVFQGHYVKMMLVPEWTRRMQYQGRHWKQ